MNKPHGSPLTDLLGLPTASLSPAHVFFGTWLTIIFLNQRADGDFTAERLLQCLPSQAFWHSGQHHHTPRTLHTSAPFGWARVTSVKPSELCTKHSPVTSEGIGYEACRVHTRRMKESACRCSAVLLPEQHSVPLQHCWCGKRPGDACWYGKGPGDAGMHPHLSQWVHSRHPEAYAAIGRESRVLGTRRPRQLCSGPCFLERSGVVGV